MQPPTNLSQPPGSQLDDWPSDEALLFGLSCGVWGAGRALVRRYQHRVYGLALTVVGNPDRAEEIAHETFLRAWRDARRYDRERASVSTWLLTITRDLARGSLRRKRAGPFDAASLIAAADRPNGTLRDGCDNETRQARAGVSNLPAEQGRALVLAAIYGYTAREISEAESIPLDTARARLRSSMAMMRSHVRGAAALKGNGRTTSPSRRCSHSPCRTT
jgi:RNA polymerase sigma factor (sigma-70 family)